MSTTISESFPRFDISMDLSRAESLYASDKSKSFSAGALLLGKFQREARVRIHAKAAAQGLIKEVWNGEFAYTLAVNLSDTDLNFMKDLCNRIHEEAFKQTGDDDWEFVNPLKNNTWYVKCKTKKGEFMASINNGKVNPEKCEGIISYGTSVDIVGTFSIWMNGARGQYGICFNTDTIDF